MCKDAPSPDPLIGQAARANAETAREALAFYRDVYTNELLPAQREQRAIGRTLIDRFLSNMDEQDRFADSQNQYYESTFRPVEQQTVRDAMGYDSPERMERQAGIAAGAANQQFSNARAQTMRSLGSFGLRPDSGAFGAVNSRLTLGQAATAAGAANEAREGVQDRAISLRAGVANFGRNMPNTAATFYGLSGASGGQAMGTSSTMQNQAAANANVMGAGFNTAIAGNQSAAGIAQADYNTRMNAYQNEQGAIGSLIGLGVTAGLGGMAGGWGGAANALAGRRLFAEGGAVRGPGGPVDDKVPAMLSNGEYVIPADVVRAKGVEFFDKLKTKYHTPAAQQRRAAISRS